MSFILHPQSGSYSIIERIYEVEEQSRKTVRLECVIEEGLSFARAKAVLKHLIQQASVQASAPIGDSPISNTSIGEDPIGDSPSQPEVLQSNAGFYIGRTFDGMPYDRLSAYFASEKQARQHLSLYQ